MSAVATKPLTVKSHYQSYRTDEPATDVVVVDSEGNEIHKGDYVRCIVTTHSWLSENELVIVESARGPANQEGGVSLSYRAISGAQSGIKAADVIRADLTPKAKQDCDLSRFYHELATINEKISSLMGRRASTETIIRQIESVKL